MAGSKLKRLRLLAVRDEMENVLRELINLGCVDVYDPVDLLEDHEIISVATKEIVSIDQLCASRDSIAMLGTQYTLMLSGWMSARSEADLQTKLTNHLCAWEISDPTPDEADVAPVDLCCPGFFGKLRSGGRKQFSPLKTGIKSEA